MTIADSVRKMRGGVVFRSRKSELFYARRNQPGSVIEQEKTERGCYTCAMAKVCQALVSGSEQLGRDFDDTLRCVNLLGEEVDDINKYSWNPTMGKKVISQLCESQKSLLGGAKDLR